jgi:hypothetical protein
MKTGVKDITFKDYVELKDRMMYDYYLEYGKLEAEDFFSVGSFFEMSFEFVKDMQYYASIGLSWEKFLEELSKVTGKDLKELSDYSIFDLHKQKLYFIEQVEKINKVESDYLGHAPTPEQVQANIDRFNSYGAFIQYDKLAGGDPLKFEDVKKLKYDFCFTKLKLESDRDSFIEDYQNIMRTKNK